jgi:hypothetical protein
MKRKLILLGVIVGLLVILQATGTGISVRRDLGGAGGSLKHVRKEHPEIAQVKERMNRAFDTSFDLARDMVDPTGDWYDDDDIRIPETGSRSLEVRSSRQTIRLLKLRNDEDGVTVKVTWQPRSDPNASWWDVTAKEFPTQRFQLKPEAEQTLVILKGGGTVTFETKGDEEKAWIEFLVDD